jgi:hypothetical protein
MDTKAKLAAAFDPKPGKFATVTLAEPIVRAGGDVTVLTLAKPLGGALRGFKIPDVVNGDWNTIAAMLPRITTPPIVSHEIDTLESEDIAEITGTIIGFFMTATDKARIAQMMGS